MLYLCCTKLGITLVNPLFIGYCKAIYDKPLLTDRLAILCRAALNQEMDLNIVNLDGQRVLHSRFQATEGVHYIADIPSHLPHGTYIVSISDIQGRQWYNTKLIRQ